jgi:hypothetical protein
MITSIKISYQPVLGGDPVYRVDYRDGAAMRFLEFSAEDAIAAGLMASKRLGIPFSLYQ